jgi:uncharacterized protein (TIGR03545 family)
MKKLIRWQGLIAFIGIVVLLSVFFIVFADKIAKMTIEKTGTMVVGAVVDLDDVDLALFPLGLKIKGLRVTNPDEPMKNAFEIMRADLSLSASNLLWRKILINKMAVDGVKFNTPRKKSGAIKVSKKSREPERSKQTESTKEELKGRKLPSFDVKDVKTILKKEKLLTLEEAKKLQNDIEQQKKFFEKQLKELPDENKFEGYKNRIKKLEKVSSFQEVLTAAKEIKTLKKDIEKDINQLKNTRKNLNATVNMLQSRLKKLPQYPMEDFRRINSKYSLSPQGMGNLTHLIFGPTYAKWVENGLVWYQKIAPIVKKGRKSDEKQEGVEPVRGKGVNVHFEEYEPLPELLIKHTSVSFEVPAGDFSGYIKNITNNQRIAGAPTTYEFDGKELKGVDLVKITGNFDHMSPDTPKDTIGATVRGFKVAGLSISDSEEFPLTLETALANLNLDAVIKGNAVDSKMEFILSSVRFQEPKEDSSIVLRSIRNALSAVTDCSITADIKGTLDKQDIKIASDLDNRLKKAISQTVMKQTEEFKAKLIKEINSSTHTQVSALKGSIAGLDSIDKKLQDRLQVGNQLTRN